MGRTDEVRVARRRRAFVPEVGQIVVLATVSWLLVAWNLSSPGLRDRVGQLKGTDFVSFYLQGHVARLGAWHLLYDPAAMDALGRTLVPEGPPGPTLYGPHVAVAFGPLSRLSYGLALTAWNGISALLLGVAAWAAWTRSPALRSSGLGAAVAVAVAGAPATVNLALHGQTSAVAAVALTAAGLAHVARWPWLTGIALGVLAYKPQLGAAAGVLFLVTGRWREIGGMAAGAAAVLAVGWVGAGGEVVLDYFRALPQMLASREAIMPKPYQMHSLQAFMALLLPARAAVFAGWAAALTAWTALAWSWPRIPDARWRWSTLLVATVLTADHVHIYDLVVLLPAFMWTADWLAQHPDHPEAARLRAVVVGSYVLPFINPLAQVTHLQVSVLALTAWFVLALQLGTSGRPVPAAG